MKFPELTPSSADTAETVISSRPAFLIGIRPRVAATAGTITIRDDSAANGTGTIRRVCPIGTLQRGIDFNGAFFRKGITITLSNGADVTDVIWEAGP